MAKWTESKQKDTSPAGLNLGVGQTEISLGEDAECCKNPTN
jgi:hypothetical protein